MALEPRGNLEQVDPMPHDTTWVWSKLASAKWADAWEERLSGQKNWTMEYLKSGKSVRLNLFCESENAARAVYDQFGGSIRKMASAEWTKPVATPRPVRVRAELLLTCESSPADLERIQRDHPTRQVISVPPEMAFGTGDHATTSTCLRMLVDVARQRRNTNWSMADLGTGTGVLAIAAMKLGAASAYACDFDPFAVAAAIRNCERNRTPTVDVQEQDVLAWEPPHPGYDVVAANLFSTVLIQAWPVIARALAPGGQLIVSGILATQAWDVFTAAASSGLGFTRVVKRGKWVSATGGHFEDLIPDASAE